MASSGKSGALFYYTKDKKYMLKSISGREFRQLIKILKDYHRHLETHPDSILVRFYGGYKLVWKNPDDKRCGYFNKKTVSYIVVMDNLFKDFEVGLRFDLKGSIKSRTRLGPDEKPYDQSRDLGVSLKCNDFRKYFT